MRANQSRILIADASKVVRRAVVRTLEGDETLGVCGECDPGPEIEHVVKRLEPALVLIDLSLRERDGFAWVTRLRREFRDLKILVFSMHSETLFAQRALRAGADGFLRKGCLEEGLLLAIHTVLNGEVFVSDALQTNILERIRGRGESDSLQEGASRLSNREAEVFELLLKGMRKHDMAAHLGISAKTIESHCAHIRRKLSSTPVSGLPRFSNEIDLT